MKILIKKFAICSHKLSNPAQITLNIKDSGNKFSTLVYESIWKVDTV